MKCPRCSADNPAGMKFCGQCGALRARLAAREILPSTGFAATAARRSAGRVCRKPLRAGHLPPNPPLGPGPRFPAK
jgi:hypothetical protein